MKKSKSFWGLYNEFLENKPSLEGHIEELVRIRNEIINLTKENQLAVNGEWHQSFSNLNEVLIRLNNTLNQVEILLNNYVQFEEKFVLLNLNPEKRIKEILVTLECINKTTSLNLGSIINLNSAVGHEFIRFKESWQRLNQLFIKKIKYFINKFGQIYRGYIQIELDGNNEESNNAHGEEMDEYQNKNGDRRGIRWVREGHYQLICAKCGKIAAEIKSNKNQINDEIRIRYKGLMYSQEIKKEFGPKIMFFLRNKSIKELHEYFKTKINNVGIDSYCPECDKFYCRDHYILDIRYVDGVYKYTHAICPKGHKKIIDDVDKI
ncbi:MAG: hypothetical protein ACTSU2_12405 [Promethearchaeota archaeon]